MVSVRELFEYVTEGKRMGDEEIEKERASATDKNHGLGRRPSFDIRDRDYPMRALIPRMDKAAMVRKLDAATRTAIERGYRYWNCTEPYLNQLAAPHCVGAAWAHFLAAGPVTQTQRMTMREARSIYEIAQRLDEWPGADYDGTSVRGGAKALDSEHLGFITEYRWAFTIDDITDALLTLGPIVFGSWWLEGMDLGNDLSARSALMIDHGRILGGHAYLLTGVNLKTGLIRVKNSWGKRWANGGNAVVSIESVERLLRMEGEACIATEIRYGDKR
jgi:hypothetical protein